MKSQLEETEKQIARLNQNEQKLKQDADQARAQLADIQRNETTMKTELTKAQKKVKFIELTYRSSVDFSTKISVRTFGNVSQKMTMMITMKINIISSKR